MMKISLDERINLNKILNKKDLINLRSCDVTPFCLGHSFLPEDSDEPNFVLKNYYLNTTEKIDAGYLGTLKQQITSQIMHNLTRDFNLKESNDELMFNVGVLGFLGYKGSNEKEYIECGVFRFDVNNLDMNLGRSYGFNKFNDEVTLIRSQPIELSEDNVSRFFRPLITQEHDFFRTIFIEDSSEESKREYLDNFVTGEYQVLERIW